MQKPLPPPVITPDKWPPANGEVQALAVSSKTLYTGCRHSAQIYSENMKKPAFFTQSRFKFQVFISSANRSTDKSMSEQRHRRL